MKYLIRSFVFTIIAIITTQNVIGGYFFGGNEFLVFILVVTGLSLLNLFMKPIFAIISLPDKGPAFFFLSFIMTLITTYVLTLVIPFFSIIATTLPELNILGVMLPSRYLTIFWSATYSALLLSVIYIFFTWLTSSKKKKGKGK